MKVGRADTEEKVALIAEIGNNHEGSITLAQEMIEAAWEAGADAVKLQTLVPELFVSPRFPDRMAQMRRFALPVEDAIGLIDAYGKRGIAVFSTPLDLFSAEQLLRVLRLVKISSGDLTFTQLLDLTAASRADVILSTGMASLEEVRLAVARIEAGWMGADERPSLAVLHCVSAYPAEASAVNLAAIGTLRVEFPTAVVGYSDHVIGVDAAARSVAAGARIVEKHFTIDKKFSDFRDHALSADPDDLRLLRVLIDEIDQQMGSGAKEPTEAELPGREAFRRSVTVRHSLEAGRILTEDDIICQRPGGGLPPSEWESVLGQALKRRVEAGHVLSRDDLT